MWYRLNLLHFLHRIESMRDRFPKITLFYPRRRISANENTNKFTRENESVLYVSNGKCTFMRRAHSGRIYWISCEWLNDSIPLRDSSFHWVIRTTRRCSENDSFQWNQIWQLAYIFLRFCMITYPVEIAVWCVRVFSENKHGILFEYVSFLAIRYLGI